MIIQGHTDTSGLLVSGLMASFIGTWMVRNVTRLRMGMKVVYAVTVSRIF